MSWQLATRTQYGRYANITNYTRRVANAHFLPRVNRIQNFKPHSNFYIIFKDNHERVPVKFMPP